MRVNVDIDAAQLADQLTGYSAEELITELMFSHEDLMRLCMRRLVEDFPDAWSSKDPEFQKDFLVAVERKFALGCKWSLLDSVIQLAREICAHKALYWRMYHDPWHRDFFCKWLSENDIPNNYTSNFPEVEDLKKFIDEKFKEMAPKSIGEQVYEKLRGEL